MGLSRDGYIDNVKLALADVLTNSPVYYITVKARNGAGKESIVMSSRSELYLPGILLIYVMLGYAMSF